MKPNLSALGVDIAGLGPYTVLKNTVRAHRGARRIVVSLPTCAPFKDFPDLIVFLYF